MTAANTPKTSAGPAALRISPLSNGPATMPAFSASEDTAFAAVSSSGSSATLGSSAWCVGRANAMLTTAAVANSIVTANGASAPSAAAVAPSAIARAR